MPVTSLSSRSVPRFVVAGLLVPLWVAIGTIGYRVIEGWSWFDALYMTVITLTTVGYREVHELSRAGETFTMVLSLGGIFTLFYATAAVLGYIVRGEVFEYFGSRRMERALAEMKDHVLVCGFGRMGRFVCPGVRVAEDALRGDRSRRSRAGGF